MLCSFLNIKHPIIQAGMAGGPTTPKLVAAVSNSGALGTLGAGYMSPEQIRETLIEIKNQTNQPFAVNLFLPKDVEKDEKQILQVQQYVNQFRKKLEIPEVNSVPDLHDHFEEQLQVVIEAGIKIISFTFDKPSRELVDRLHGQGITVIATATHVSEAVELEKSGVDVIVAQGSEAGGHRGSFLETDDEPLVGTMALVPQIVDRVSCPVVAAGGISDGRGVVAALALGASGVQLGTAFLTVHESGANDLHKEAILNSKDTDTKITKAFSGKNARGFKNLMMTELDEFESLPPYPVQNALTSDIRKAATKKGEKEFMSMWAGQASALSKKTTAKELIEELTRDMNQGIARLNKYMSR